ncbi:MAG: ABC transporter ATP-binding protein [Candidatus Eremiobacteraeota bacterium]|nr:ABC transporter ATP-binding protein [Candidatus Eremiobacteraeota bacterium]MCL5054937.1 ABC transporter ATP-binding protein [Bacillota bacterium]
MAKVILEGVSKSYTKSAAAVQDIHLEIKDREFMVLVGPSGCGKTTLLRLIAGLEEPSLGKIFIGGREVTHLSPRDRDIAMVFQNYALYPHLTIFENMAFGLKLRKIPSGEIKKRVQEVSSMLGIEMLLNRKPRELSGGQRQRAAMGRAIVREPKLFLMDEPLSNLDAQFRVQMRAELRKLHERIGATTLYVTHDQTEAMTLGHRIALMNNGVLQQVDTPLNLYHYPDNLFAAGFIGSPAMNFFDGQIKQEGNGLCLSVKDFETVIPLENRSGLLPYLDKEVVVGIRPDGVLLGSDSPQPERFKAVVEMIEPLGSETYVYLKWGNEGQLLTSVLSSSASLSFNEEVSFSFNKGDFYFFDKKTGQRLID